MVSFRGTFLIGKILVFLISLANFYFPSIPVLSILKNYRIRIIGLNDVFM